MSAFSDFLRGKRPTPAPAPPAAPAKPLPGVLTGPYQNPFLAQHITVQATPEQIAQAQTQANIALQRVSAGLAKPSCLSPSQKKTADSLCAQKRMVGQEAVAAFGRALGATDPFASMIAQAPCEWSLIAACPTGATPVAVASSPAPPAMQLPPGVKPPPLPPPPERHSDTPMIVGGVVLGALVLGGVFFVMRKKAA